MDKFILRESPRRCFCTHFWNNSVRKTDSMSCKIKPSPFWVQGAQYSDIHVYRSRNVTIMTTNGDVCNYLSVHEGRDAGNNSRQAKCCIWWEYFERETLLIRKLNEFIGHVKSVYTRHGRISIGKENLSLKIMPYGRSGGNLTTFWRKVMPLSSLFYSSDGGKRVLRNSDAYHTIWRNIPEDGCINRRDNLKSHNKCHFIVK